LDSTSGTAAMKKEIIIAVSLVGALMLLLLLAFFVKRRLGQGRIRSADGELKTAFKVVQAYFPHLIDEIQLNMGDIVIVKAKFDDGWGFGLNITTESEGSFPLNCLSDIKSNSSRKFETKIQIHTVRDASLTKNSLEKHDPNIPTGERKQRQQNNLNPKSNTTPRDSGDILFSPVTITQPEPAKSKESYNSVYSTVKVLPKSSDKDQYERNLQEIYNTVKVLPNSPAHKFNKQESVFNTLKNSPSSKYKKEEKMTADDFYNTVKILPNSPVHKNKNENSDEEIYGTVKVLPNAPSHKYKNESSKGNKDEEIYGTVKVLPNATPKKFTPENFFNSVKLGRGQNNTAQPVSPDSLSRSPDSLSRLPKVLTRSPNRLSKASLASISTDPDSKLVTPVTPTKFDKASPQKKKSPRKFANDELKYGTAKSSLSSGYSKSARPTYTTTFNNNLKK
jgi:hypothetical protein